jgi:hypothetical protein
MKRLYYNMLSYRMLLAGLLLPCVWACAGIKAQAGGPDPVYITDEKAFHLLPPSALGGTRSVHQIIEGSYGERSYSFEAFVQADHHDITMIALTPFGSGLYEIIFDGSTVFFQSGVTPAGTKPAYLVADFQFCYFPADQLAASANRTGLTFRETATPDGWHRQIMDGNRVIIDITRTGSTLVFTNRLRSYGYSIRELSE